MKTLFTKIIHREIPAVILYEDDHCISILDKFPTVEGQSLIIPKVEIDYVFDLEDDLYTHLFHVAKKIARALDKSIQPVRTCLVVEGFEIPHVHIKLFPVPDENLKTSGGPEVSNDNLEVIATRIRKHL